MNPNIFPTAGYPAAQSTTNTYSQSTQSYGASGYESTPAAAAPAASQSYGSQPGYTAQSAYPGYGQQAAPTAPQRYVPLRLKPNNGNSARTPPSSQSMLLSFCDSALVTMLAANQQVTAKVATLSQQHMGNSNLATRPSRLATVSSKDTSSRPSSQHRLLQLTLLRLLVLMVSLQPTSTVSKVDLLVTTSPTTTVSLLNPASNFP